ncbi:helix-turn-helix domain-containing protein [Paenibacillus thermotolerans]|uniref:helix-turn-helix domain-containing protein n=1 Tax=Paenibacillus thermotolerans TaxID=3027807 RepID=UPI00236818E8|nr:MULTISPECIES: AraC family transcriptional regulator [unclassified Paenibacillus]
MKDAELCYDAVAVLNGMERRLHDDQSAFEVLYWGAQRDHRDNPVHKHSFLEVCYVLDGYGSYEEYKQGYPLAPQTLFLSRPGIPHQIRSEHGMLLYWVAFRLDSARSEPHVVEQFRRLSSSSRVLQPGAGETPSSLLWRSLYRHAADRHYGLLQSVPTLACALLRSFVSSFLEADASSAQHQPLPVHHSSASSLLHQARIYISDNLAGELYLQDVAAYLHISGRHLSRLFMSELGVTFIEYVNRQRIAEARHLLRTTDIPIRIVAERCGFSSVHYFTRVFCTAVKTTPAQFRKQWWDKDNEG